MDTRPSSMRRQLKKESRLPMDHHTLTPRRPRKAERCPRESQGASEVLIEELLNLLPRDPAYELPANETVAEELVGRGAARRKPRRGFFDAPYRLSPVRYGKAFSQH